MSIQVSLNDHVAELEHGRPNRRVEPGHGRTSKFSHRKLFVPSFPLQLSPDNQIAIFKDLSAFLVILLFCACVIWNMYSYLGFSNSGSSSLHDGEYPGRNFARHSNGAGAQNIASLTSPSRSTGNHEPTTVLQDTAAYWCFEGRTGHFGMALEHVINISHISIGYQSTRPLTPTNAPRSMVLWGLAEGKESVETVKRAVRSGSYPSYHNPAFQKTLQKITSAAAANWTPLIHFQYDFHLADQTQLFAIPSDVTDIGVSYGVVVLEIVDNWGSKEETCIQQIGVYGIPNN